MIDAVTAVTGSGPGYVFHFMAALEQGAVELGFAPAEARRLAVSAFRGAAALAAALAPDAWNGWAEAARAWDASQAARPDLGENLADFCAELAKKR